MSEPIYIETGRRWSYAGALEWPGWCRHAKGSADPVAELFAVALRYRDALAHSELAFQAPAGVEALEIVERLPGNSGTEWGVPSVVPEADRRALDEAETARLAAILAATWREFDAAVEEAAGHELRKGPRGGGRDLEGIIDHVLESEGAYLSKLGSRKPKVAGTDRGAIAAALRSQALETFRARAAGDAVRELQSHTRAVAAPLLRALHRLAHPPPRLGDRGPQARPGSSLIAQPGRLASGSLPCRSSRHSIDRAWAASHVSSIARGQAEDALAREFARWFSLC